MTENSSPVPLPDVTMHPDIGLWNAAKADAEKLRRDYIDAVRALAHPARGDEEQRSRMARLDRSRAFLAQALTILDMARGD